MGRPAITLVTVRSRSGHLLQIFCCLVGLIVGRHACSASLLAQAPDPLRRVNAPFFDGDVRFAEMAVFWFGYVDSSNNYADVRVGYNDRYLYVRVAAFDRYLWYDTSPSSADLTEWDAAALYLDLAHDGGSTPGADDYCFIGQLVWWEDREESQAVYRGNGAGWVVSTIPFTTTSGWRGNVPNDYGDDRGWTLGVYVPFESLGLSGPPPRGAVWGVAVVLHDRDDAVGTPIADKTWPEIMSPEQPGTWGELAFGLPTYDPAPARARGMVTIRQGTEGARVADAAVGGTIGNLCPGDPDVIWNQWGEANFAGAPSFNLQNQADVADWPCFARYYVTFPLDALPSGKVIISATLTLHEWGGSGGPEDSEPQPSLIQALTLSQDWDEATLTWNNAPLAKENVSAAWVDPLPPPRFIGWPGAPWTWDVSGPVAEAYTSGEPLRLSLYEADAAQHSGKYFSSSDAEDWNAEGRPTLRVRWGDPVPTVDKTVLPSAAMPGDMLTYTVDVVGSGHALTLTDELPAGVSAPLAHSPSMVYTPHRLSWIGRPDVGEPVTLTYAVTVAALTEGALWNKAILTEAGGLTYTATALVLAGPVQIYLPLIARGGT